MVIYVFGKRKSEGFVVEKMSASYGMRVTGCGLRVVDNSRL